MKKELLTVKELAAELRMSVKSIQRGYRKRDIPMQWCARSARMAGRARRGGMVYLVYFVDRIGSPTRRTRETNIVFPQTVRSQARQEGAEKYIFSVLLPTLCLHGDRLEGGWCVSA
jgi:hypothetical protein